MFVVYYRPQRSCGKVMVLHMCVILFTRGGGVVSDIDPHSHWQTPPRQTPLGQTPTPPPVTATVADSTHPTGMHSCFLIIFACSSILFAFVPAFASCEWAQQVSVSLTNVGFKQVHES